MTRHNITQNRMTAGRAIISALALWLAFSGVAAAEQFYVNEGGWWREGGAFNASGTPIQAAVGAADVGDSIYVHGGNYYENVDVNKRLTLEGEGADVVTVTAADPGDHVFDVTADWVNISGFAVTGALSTRGICLHGRHYYKTADHCNISDNIVSDNKYGIYLSISSNNTIENNIVNSNNYCGILLWSSSNNNVLVNNIMSDNNKGIYLSTSSNNRLENNTVDLTEWYGIHLEHSSNNMLTNNIINSNNYSGIGMSNADRNNLTSNTVNSNSHYGIILWGSSNNIITCNWVQNNGERGFYIEDIEETYYIDESSGNNISYNNIIENGNYNTGTGGWEWQFYTGQYQPVEAKHNHWGAGMNNSTIDASIYDDDEGMGKVEFYPFETEPVQCPLTPELPAFNTTDAVIALQIAAGSRPSDLCYDVSGDGSVTSLDALMILQAAAGAIGL